MRYTVHVTIRRMQKSELHRQVIVARVRDAVWLIRSQIRWKAGKAIQHVQTRIRYGHLPPSATVADYEAIIVGLVNDDFADVYLYIWNQRSYPTIASTYQGQCWLVMFGVDGVMETAFPPTDLDEYLADIRFQFLGKLEELMR